MATVADVLNELITELTGVESGGLHDLVDQLEEPGPASPASPVPADAQPSEADTPNPVFGSETEPQAPDPAAPPGPMGG